MTKTKYNPYEEITNQVVQAMKDHGTSSDNALGNEC